MEKVRDFIYYGNDEIFGDDPMKDIWISFAEKTLNLEYIYGNKYGIDCVLKDNFNIGAEGERGSWNFDRWASSQRDLFRLGFNTLNIQNSKWHYWGFGEYSEKNWGKYIITHPGFEHNKYFRINEQKDQICFVDADVIRDFNKIKFVFNRKVYNGKKVEDWICVPQEYVKTYNKQPDGTWILNGKYWGPTMDEYRQKRIEELKNNNK